MATGTGCAQLVTHSLPCRKAARLAVHSASVPRAKPSAASFGGQCAWKLKNSLTSAASRPCPILWIGRWIHWHFR